MTITIPLRPEAFQSCAGLFPEVTSGNLTEIVNRFAVRDQDLNQNDILQLLCQQDEL